jgi:nickel/cobalt transporter (NiCoT) family protein
MTENSRPGIRDWFGPGGWRRAGGALGIVALLHVLAFGLLLGFVIPGDFSIDGKVFGLGLGMVAYTLGVRHAFDADHIAAIDNTTRKLVNDGKRPVSVGLFFSLGHSTIVFVMALLIAAGAGIVGALADEGSTANQTLGLIGTSVSGVFLLLIGIINLLAFTSIWRVWREAKHGKLDELELEKALDARGFMARLLRPLLKAVKRPGQMYPIGVLFGLGFDTATEISILLLAGAGAVTGLPWYAVLVLPLLFAAGMSLFDTLDGAFMQAAYQWAFVRPVRKVYYNLATTGLSVAAALLIGGIELIGILHEKAGLTDPITTAIASVDLENVGYILVGLFLATWVIAVGYWKLGRVEDRWTAALRSTPAG